MFTTYEILTARIGATFDGLIVADRSWPADAPKPGPELEPGSDAWYEAIGPAGTVYLTSDGRGANTYGWCECGGQTGQVWFDSPGIGEGQVWVRYERYTPAGREAHGWVHQGCRMLLQVG
jgi:hypothetical protein